MHTGSGVVHTGTESWPSEIQKRGVMAPEIQKRGVMTPGTQELKGETGCSGSENSGHPFVARWCGQSRATRSGSSQDPPGSRPSRSLWHG
jgi:hypothetical protein